jgi:hypothetical protein
MQLRAETIAIDRRPKTTLDRLFYKQQAFLFVCVCRLFMRKNVLRGNKQTKQNETNKQTFPSGTTHFTEKSFAKHFTGHNRLILDVDQLFYSIVVVVVVVSISE